MRAGRSDTAPEVEELLVEGYRRMSAREKVARVADLNRTVRALARAGIRERHGSDLTPEEERIRLAALTLDRETLLRVCGWDSDEHGL